MSSGIDFSKVATDTANNVNPAINYILGLNITPEEKKKRIETVFNLIGSDFYTQMFDANSTVFDSAAIKTTDYNELTEQTARLSNKIVQNYNLGRETKQLVKDYYDSALGQAQSEAFRNAISLDKHPTVSRSMVGETCGWCQSLVGTFPYMPNSDVFRRHANCDCLIVVNGLGKRSGVVNNYKKKSNNKTVVPKSKKGEQWSNKNSVERQKHLSSTLKKLEKYNETTAKFADVLEGKPEAKLGEVTGDVAKKLGVRPNTNIYIKRNYALHMDNSGHFSGSGFGKNGHNDKNPLTMQQISDIPTIIKTAKKDKISLPDKTARGTRYAIVSNLGKYQLTVVEVVRRKNRIDIVTSYTINKTKYRKFLDEKQL